MQTVLRASRPLGPFTFGLLDVIGTHYRRATGACDFARNSYSDNGVQIHFVSTATDCRECTWEQVIIATLDRVQLITMPLLCSSVSSRTSLAPLDPDGCRPSAQGIRGNCLRTTMLHGPCIDCVGAMSLLPMIDMQPLAFYSKHGPCLMI